jgi:O-antigen/teichoic acid export membrane protein
LFLILQIAVVVSFQVDSLVIARLLGAAEVTNYAVPMKLFMVVPLLLGFGLVPLWPAYREALTRRDTAWARNTLRQSLKVTAGVSVLLTGILVSLGGPILRWWVGGAVEPSTFLLLGLGAFVVAYSIGTAIAMFLNGAQILGFQVVTAVCMMAMNLVLSIVLTKYIGISGPAWGSAIALVVCVFAPSAWYLRGVFQRLEVTPTVGPSATGELPTPNSSAASRAG